MLIETVSEQSDRHRRERTELASRHAAERLAARQRREQVRTDRRQVRSWDHAQEELLRLNRTRTHPYTMLEITRIAETCRIKKDAVIQFIRRNMNAEIENPYG